MKLIAFALALGIGILGVAGCTEVEIENENRFMMYAGAGSDKPILLDQATGETWRLTDAGWQQLGVVDEDGETEEWEGPDD